MNNLAEDSIRVNVAHKRKWKILRLMLVVMCLGSFIVLVFFLVEDFNPSGPTSNSLPTITTDDIKYGTSTNLADVASSKIHDITTMEVFTSSEISTLSTMIVNQAEQYRNYTLLNPIEYEQSFGRPLGNTLYSNTNLYCWHDGYVSSVYLRLFTNWTGNAPLYVFIMEVRESGLGVKQRYVIQPQRDTTDWQIINIPSHELPISVGNLLAIGMQDSSNTNQIYGVKSAAQGSVMGFLGKNMSASTTLVGLEASHSLGFALGYTMVDTNNKRKRQQ